MKKTVNSVVEAWAEPEQAIFKNIQAVIKKFSPKVEERSAWAGIGYKVDKNYLCQVYPGKQGLNVMIMRGVMLRDPKGLLDGAGKNTRNFRVKSVDSFDEDSLVYFLSQQEVLYKSGVTWE